MLNVVDRVPMSSNAPQHGLNQLANDETSMIDESTRPAPYAFPRKALRRRISAQGQKFEHAIAFEICGSRIFTTERWGGIDVDGSWFLVSCRKVKISRRGLVCIDVACRVCRSGRNIEYTRRIYTRSP